MSRWKTRQPNESYKDNNQVNIKENCRLTKELKISNLINVVNKLIQLPKPALRILVLEICPHCPHYMICARNIGLKQDIISNVHSNHF